MVADVKAGSKRGISDGTGVDLYGEGVRVNPDADGKGV